MKVRVNIKKKAIKQLSESQAKAMTFTAMQMLNEVRNEGLIPFDTGNLQNESTYVDDSNVKNGEVSIVSDTPYARKLYFHPEYNFNTSKNLNAGGEWWENWIAGNKRRRPIHLFKEFYRRLTGGVVK